MLYCFQTFFKFQNFFSNFFRKFPKFVQGTTSLGDIGIFPTCYACRLEDSNSFQIGANAPERPKTPHMTIAAPPPTAEPIHHPPVPVPHSVSQPQLNPTSYDNVRLQNFSSSGRTYSNLERGPTQNIDPYQSDYSRFSNGAQSQSNVSVKLPHSVPEKVPHSNGYRSQEAVFVSGSGRSETSDKLSQWQKKHIGSRFTGSAQLVPKGSLVFVFCGFFSSARVTKALRSLAFYLFCFI